MTGAHTPCRPPLRPTLMSISPSPVHTNSRSLTISATNMPWPAVSPSPTADMTKPPSLPPSCKGMKNSMLAKSDVNASMSTHVA